MKSETAFKFWNLPPFKAWYFGNLKKLKDFFKCTRKSLWIVCEVVLKRSTSLLVGFNRI